MRLSRLASLALVGGVAAWQLREHPAVTRLLRGHGLQQDDDGADEQAPERPAAAAPTSSESTDEPELAPAGAIVDEVVEGDAEALIGVERELLTVPGEPGETHRRRDQTAGVEAQEIAAAQVRARRNGSDDLDELDA